MVVEVSRHIDNQPLSKKGRRTKLKKSYAAWLLTPALIASMLLPVASTAFAAGWSIGDATASGTNMAVGGGTLVTDKYTMTDGVNKLTLSFTGLGWGTSGTLSLGPKVEAQVAYQKARSDQGHWMLERRGSTSTGEQPATAAYQALSLAAGYRMNRTFFGTDKLVGIYRSSDAVFTGEDNGQYAFRSSDYLIGLKGIRGTGTFLIAVGPSTGYARDPADESDAGTFHGLRLLLTSERTYRLSKNIRLNLAGSSSWLFGSRLSDDEAVALGHSTYSGTAGITLMF